MAAGRSGVGTTVFCTLLDSELAALSNNAKSASKRLWKSLLALADAAATLATKAQGGARPADAAAPSQLRSQCDKLGAFQC